LQVALRIKFLLAALVLLNVVQAGVIVGARVGHFDIAPPNCRIRVFGVEVDLPNQYVLRSSDSHIAHFRSAMIEKPGGLTTGRLSTFAGLSEDLWVLDDELKRNGLEIKKYYRASGGGPVPLIFISDGEEYVTVLDPNAQVWQSIITAVGKK